MLEHIFANLIAKGLCTYIDLRDNLTYEEVLILNNIIFTSDYNRNAVQYAIDEEIKSKQAKISH